MPQTSIWALRYPTLADAPNGPLQIGNLAADAEAMGNTLKAATDAAALADVSWRPRILTLRLASDYTVGGLADVTGLSITFSTVNPNTVVQMTMNMSVKTSEPNYVQGVFNVDGVDHAVKCAGGQNGNVDAQTYSQTAAITLAAAGSHTIKVRAATTGGVSTLGNTATGLTLIVMGA